MIDIYKQYDRIGKDYIKGQTDFYVEVKDQASDFIIQSLPELKNKVILDLGCGHGKGIYQYEKMSPKNIYGIDSSEYMIKEAKRNVKDPEKISVSGIENTPFEDNFFDVIISRYALHYVDDPDNAFREIARILKKEGSLVFIIPHPMADLMIQKDKTYGKKEVLNLELYNDHVQIHYPSHTMSEYLSKFFLENFNLTGFLEGTQSDRSDKIEFNLPAFLGISAIKR